MLQAQLDVDPAVPDPGARETPEHLALASDGAADSVLHVTADLVEALENGEVNLDDPAVTLALLQLDAVVGVKGRVAGAS